MPIHPCTIHGSSPPVENELMPRDIDNETNALPERQQPSLLDELSGAFGNTIKSQANGAIQLFNHVTHNKIEELEYAQTSKADFASARWFAQIAGQAAGVACQFFVLRKACGRLSRENRVADSMAAGHKRVMRVQKRCRLVGWSTSSASPTERCHRSWWHRSRQLSRHGNRSA